MEQVEKQLRKMPRPEREWVMDVMEQITQRNFSGLNLKQMKGVYCIFRVRVGNYRIIYFDDGKTIEFLAVRRRNESTYDDF